MGSLANPEIANGDDSIIHALPVERAFLHASDESL